MKRHPDNGFLGDEETEEAAFTEEFASQLAERFNLEGREEALLDAINHAAYLYRLAQRMAPPNVKEQRKLIQRVHLLSTNLDEAVNKLGLYERGLLRNWIRSRGSHLLPETFTAIKQLKYSSYKALEALPLKPGPTKKYDFRTLVDQLYETYSEMTGDRRKYTYVDKNEEYKGPALDFIQQCLHFLNIRKSDSTVIGILKEVLADQG
jgi:hypothetical protein